MLFRKPVNVTPHQQQQQQQSQSSKPSAKSPPSSQTPMNNNLGTPANEDTHSPSPKRVTIVEPGVATSTRGGGGGGDTAATAMPAPAVKGGGPASKKASFSSQSPPATPPGYSNRNGQPPNVPSSCLKDANATSFNNQSFKDNGNPISNIAAPIIKSTVYASSYDEEEELYPVGGGGSVGGGGGAGGGGEAIPIIASVRRPSAPRGSSIESGGSGSSRPSNGGGGGSGGGAAVGGGGGGGGGPPSFSVTFAPSVKTDDAPAPRSRSVERDLDEFVRECSVARNTRARSVATGRNGGEGTEVLSRLDALVNDVVNTSTLTTAQSRGRSRGKSPGNGGGSGGGVGGRSASLMTRSSHDQTNFDLSGNVPPEQQQRRQLSPAQSQRPRGRSMLRDAELDRIQRDVASMSPKPRGASVAREFSMARELSMGREFAAPVESTVSKVYVSSLEPTDKICLKVRAAIQREVTMMNKKVDLVWNKIQTLKETNDIMEEIICQTEDELCYCEELTDAVGLDLSDIVTDAEDREQLLTYELQLLQEMRRVQEEAAEDGDVDGPLDGEAGGLEGEGGADDPLQKRSSINAMKKKAQKKFTRLKRRESEDIMNSTRCKIS